MNFNVLIGFVTLDRKIVVFGRRDRGAVSVIRECEAREPHTPAGGVKRLSPFSLAVFSLAQDLSFEYGPSLAFAKNTAVLQFIVTLKNEEIIGNKFQFY